jgi:mannose-6-phosphate isomerase-like protein (cupin superfamily)
MSGYVANIEEETVRNQFFRKVLFTGPFSQLVVMSLQPGEEIGEEVHSLDQFIRIEAGEAQVTLGAEAHRLRDDFAIVIPAGVKHNVKNISASEALKLYTIYSPPEHAPGTIHLTKREAEEGEAAYHLAGISS